MTPEEQEKEYQTFNTFIETLKILIKEDLEELYAPLPDEEDENQKPYIPTEEEIRDAVYYYISQSDDGMIEIRLEQSIDCEYSGEDMGPIIYTDIPFWLGGYEQNEDYKRLLKEYGLDGRVIKSENVNDCPCDFCMERAKKAQEKLSKALPDYYFQIPS